MSRPGWTTLHLPRRRPRRVHVVLWGARRGDLQAGSPADLELAELLRRRVAMFRGLHAAQRSFATLGVSAAQAAATLAAFGVAARKRRIR